MLGVRVPPDLLLVSRIGRYQVSKIGNFFKECVGELKKVVWPSRVEVWSSVKVVVISTILVAAFLGALDALLMAGVLWMF